MYRRGDSRRMAPGLGGLREDIQSSIRRRIDLGITGEIRAMAQEIGTESNRVSINSSVDLLR